MRTLKRRRTGWVPWCAALAVVSAAIPHPAPGQLVDRGAFVLYRNGVEVGVEDFSIHRQGTGGAQLVVATSTVRVRDGPTLTTSLSLAGPEMAPSEYSVMAAGTDTTSVRIVRAGRRFRSRRIDSAGEEERAYPIRGASVVLDEGVAHLYFVLAEIADGSVVHPLVPLEGRQVGAARIERAAETIRTGGAPTEATRVRLGSVGEAWFDGSGRLLRVRVGEGGFVAERRP
ncbi:MAG: hypothetical protein J4F34_05725 [Gemmatimonadetes bacterium]|nr:hypothetical protein [Gemmatimonadota bacterium]